MKDAVELKLRPETLTVDVRALVRLEDADAPTLVAESPLLFADESPPARLVLLRS